MSQPVFSLRAFTVGDARMVLSVARFIRDDLGVDIRGEKLVIAFSGGADSTALLTVFCALRESLQLSLVAAHLDHGLRPESASDAEAAKALCLRFGVPFLAGREHVGELSRTWHCGVEEAGRRARYAFLENCRLQQGARWVLTAHHVGDLAEDVLMRLSRGSVWPALGGMKAVVDEPGRHILRPLLMQEKETLEAMLQRLGISWREDASNASRTWKRNRVRHDLIPLFLKENPSFYESVRRLWRSARRDEHDWKIRTEHGLEERDGSLFLSDRTLHELCESDRMRLMAEALHRLQGEVRADTLESVNASWKRRHFPRRFSFGGGVKARLDGGGLCFFRASGR